MSDVFALCVYKAGTKQGGDVCLIRLFTAALMKHIISQHY